MVFEADGKFGIEIYLRGLLEDFEAIFLETILHYLQGHMKTLNTCLGYKTRKNLSFVTKLGYAFAVNNLNLCIKVVILY